RSSVAIDRQVRGPRRVEAGAVFLLQHDRASLDRARVDDPDAVVGYCFGIRSERRFCEEVHLNWHTACSLGFGSRATCPTIRRARAAGVPIKNADIIVDHTQMN